MPNLAQDVIGNAPRTEGLRVDRVTDDVSASGVYRRLTVSPAAASHMLAKHQYFKQVQLEKRRTDRSKAPLSMIVFHADSTAQRGMQNIKGLADMLQRSKRETDILGYIGEGRLALLLPDTNGTGVETLIRNLRARAGELEYTTTSSTYPDALFDSLLAADTLLTEAFPLLIEDASSASARSEGLKRAFDLVGSTLLLLLLSPVMIATAVAIATTSRGPVIFKQIRLGRRGVPFVFYKFRSMLVGADDTIHRDYVASLINGQHEQVNQGDDASPHYKIKSDPRVTGVGSFIRATSIDELPQLFNVVKGDMSLVGPRPPLPYEAEKYQSWHLRRVLESRPGITGLWQVEGRSRTSFDDMVRLDLRYIRNCSLKLDLKILLKTVLVVLRRDGAT
jgi:lipopolysaccharide/colanic/teichoic acid biosynthesis glycosyltransferase